MAFACCMSVRYSVSPAAPKKLSLSIFSLFFQRNAHVQHTYTGIFSPFWRIFRPSAFGRFFFSTLQQRVCMCLMVTKNCCSVLYTNVCVCLNLSVWNFSENIYLYGVCNKNQYIKSRHSNFQSMNMCVCVFHSHNEFLGTKGTFLHKVWVLFRIK